MLVGRTGVTQTECFPSDSFQDVAEIGQEEQLVKKVGKLVGRNHLAGAPMLRSQPSKRGEKTCGTRNVTGGTHAGNYGGQLFQDHSNLN